MKTLVKLSAIASVSIMLVACGGGGGGGSSIDPTQYAYKVGPNVVPYSINTEFNRSFFGTGVGISAIGSNPANAGDVKAVAPDAEVWTPLAKYQQDVNSGLARQGFSSGVIVAPTAQVNQALNSTNNFNINGVFVATTNAGATYVVGGSINQDFVATSNATVQPRAVTSVGVAGHTGVSTREGYLAGTSALIMSKFNLSGERAADSINSAVISGNFTASRLLAPNAIK